MGIFPQLLSYHDKQHELPLSELRDTWQRPIDYVRLSVTDLCNFKCDYCLPNGYPHKKTPNELSIDEITQLGFALKALGVRKIRLTGGEPSLRQDLTDIIFQLKKVVGIDTVALTTNGYKLAQHMDGWHEAGLDELNISIDSFDETLFASMTGVNALPNILMALEDMINRGLWIPNINAVLYAEHGAQQLAGALDFVRQHAVSVRFIELMETGLGKEVFFRQHVSSQQVIEKLLGQGFSPAKSTKHVSGPAEYYQHPNYLGKIGVIRPYSEHFCERCNRIRISSTGHVHLCLFDSKAHSIRHLMNPQHQSQLQTTLSGLLHQKPKRHGLNIHDTGLMLHLSQLGG